MSENLSEPLENPFDREVPVRRSRWRVGLAALAAVSSLMAGVWGGVALADGEGGTPNWWAYDTVDGDGEAGPFFLEKCQAYVAERQALGYDGADCYEEVPALDDDGSVDPRAEVKFYAVWSSGGAISSEGPTSLYDCEDRLGALSRAGVGGSYCTDVAPTSSVPMYRVYTLQFERKVDGPMSEADCEAGLESIRMFLPDVYCTYDPQG